MNDLKTKLPKWKGRQLDSTIEQGGRESLACERSTLHLKAENGEIEFKSHFPFATRYSSETGAKEPMLPSSSLLCWFEK